MLRVALFLALLLSSAFADDVGEVRSVSQVADSFFSGYLKFIAKGGGYEDAIKWIDKSPVPTKEYKSALAKLYRDALKTDPELGYGADAVICGQDWPEKGFKASRVWLVGPMAFVQMTSRDPQFDHFIEARFIKVDGAWRLDGTGSLSGGAMLAAREVLSDAQLTERIVGLWKDGSQEATISNNGKWKDEDGVGTWKIKNGTIFRSGSDAKGEPFPLYLVNESTLVYTDGEGVPSRLTRANSR